MKFRITDRESGYREVAIARITVEPDLRLSLPDDVLLMLNNEPAHNMRKLLSQVFGGYTIRHIEGGWEDKQERGIEIEVSYPYKSLSRWREGFERCIEEYAFELGAEWVHVEYRPEVSAGHFRIEAVHEPAPSTVQPGAVNPAAYLRDNDWFRLPWRPDPKAMVADNLEPDYSPTINNDRLDVV